MNDLLARTNGHSVAEHLGRRMDEMAPDLADQIVPIFRKVLETGHAALAEELRGPTRWDPARERTWLTSWYPVRSGTREVRGVIVVVKDVTALKRREIEIVASWYLCRHHLVEVDVRFDVISITVGPNGRLEHLEDAWRPESAWR